MKIWGHWSARLHSWYERGEDRARMLWDRLLDRLRKRLLDFLNLPAPRRPRRIPEWALQQRAEAYCDWVRKKESAADIGRELLSDKQGFRDWAERFGPDPENWPDEEGNPFHIPAPLSYPAIVVWFRLHRDGLVACEFYWDYVTPADFGEVQ